MTSPWESATPKSKAKGKGPKSGRKGIVEEVDLTVQAAQSHDAGQACADALGESGQSTRRKRMGSMSIKAKALDDTHKEIHGDAAGERGDRSSSTKLQHLSLPMYVPLLETSAAVLARTG
jgi:hypothetical protein